MWGDWRKKKRWKRGEDKREREMIGARACNASARSPFLFSLAFSRAWRGVEPGAPRGRVWIGEGACVAAMASLRALSLSTGRERHLPPIARALLLYRLPETKTVGNGWKRYYYFIIFSKTIGNGRKTFIFMNSSI